MKRLYNNLFCIGVIFFAACNNDAARQAAMPPSSDSLTKGSYAYDADFLKKHTRKVVELQDSRGQAKLLLSADYQGRVMTSAATGDSGNSYGWMNYAQIAAVEKKKQFNAVGGENRFWMGPEGGQYSLYFKKGDSFNIAHWQVPAIIDTVMYDVLSAGKTEAVFGKKTAVINYSGTVFDIAIERKITLLDQKQVAEKIGFPLPSSIHFVAYETDNRIENTGNADWKKENGLLSIWLLGMMTPTDQTTVIIPFEPQQDIHQYITDNYFGEVPPERLKIKDSVLYFTCDGKQRSKIGLSPVIAKSIAASYDFKKNVLTLILFPVERGGRYVNSKWELQKQPYKGDVVNSYNDGPLQDGTQLGPFYEIESSSPALELKKGQIQEYKQTTCHFEGDYKTLRDMVKQLLGVDLDEVKNKHH